MKQVFNQSGNIVVEEVPPPSCGDNEVVVQNIYSLISTGTEGSYLKQGGKGVIGLASRAKNNPELVSKAINMAKREGVGKTLNVIRGQAEGKLSSLGYSSCGVMLEV